jgi:hypothetical protein
LIARIRNSTGAASSARSAGHANISAAATKTGESKRLMQSRRNTIGEPPGVFPGILNLSVAPDQINATRI